MSSMQAEDLYMKQYLRKITDITNKVRRAVARKFMMVGISSAMKTAVTARLKAAEEEKVRSAHNKKLAAEEEARRKAEENRLRMEALREKMHSEAQEKERQRLEAEAVREVRNTAVLCLVQ